MPGLIVATPDHIPEPWSVNWTAIASPNTPPPAYMPFAPTVMFAVLTDNVTLYVDGWDDPHSGNGQFEDWVVVEPLEQFTSP